MRLHLIRLAGFALSSVVGLLTYMFLAGVVGLGTLLRWYGDSMLSLVYGLITLGVGAIAYYFIAIGILTLLHIKPTMGISVATGFVFGIVFQSILPIMGSYLKDLPFWRDFDNVSQVQVGMGAVGLFGVIVATVIVVLITMLVNSRGTGSISK